MPEQNTNNSSRLFWCGKCKENFHPSWLETHKQSHRGEGGFVGLVGKIQEGE